MSYRLMSLGIAGLALASFSIAAMAPASFSEGALEANSEATATEGFPVLTGPGATVLTPDGAYVMPGAGSTKIGLNGSALTAADKHVVVGSVKCYSWNHGRAQVRAYRARTAERLSVNRMTY